MTDAGFLDLPARTSKPRSRGLTHAIDQGVPVTDLATRLRSSASWVDLWKFGFGTAYLDPCLDEKLGLLAEHDVSACIGGTLLEVAWSQGAAAACLDWAAEHRLPMIEVSDGLGAMTAADRSGLIAVAAERFVVVAEVGSKDPAVPVNPTTWARQAQADLQAGARFVIAEARESGTVGLYRSDGSVREEVVGALVAAVGLDAVIFEAPRKDQQAWFIRRFGADVNLGNVAPPELMGLEALRLGLRADTIAREPMPLRAAP